jgi:hypothetical protein
MSQLPRTITIDEQSVDAVWRGLDDPRHRARLSVTSNGDVYLDFTSRLGLYCLGLSLLECALREEGYTIEFFPLCPINEDGSLEEDVVEGLRLSAESTRLFVSYPRGADEIKELPPGA